MAVALARLEKVWNIKETDNTGRWCKEMINNAVLETMEAKANARNWAHVADKAVTYARRGVGDMTAGARARQGAEDAASAANTERLDAEFYAKCLAEEVEIYDGLVLSNAYGNNVWEAIIRVKRDVTQIKAVCAVAKYYADMAKTFVDKARECNVWEGWDDGIDKVAVAQGHAAEVAKHAKMADDANEKILKSIIIANG
jgi:hypothetical protein